jgi:gamma-glutamylcyclotransferase (GGCT)/AIG2-like uncharacterized protein YtfP
MPSLLFIYGTLHPDRAPSEIAAVARRLTPIGSATIRARLYDLGAYPGVILADEADTVPGELFAVPDDATLAALDTYEDYHPADPTNSLFLRTETVVTLDDGTQHTCWVYVYNGRLPKTKTPRGA